MKGYSLYAALVSPLRRNRVFHRILFGFWPQRIDSPGSIFWDWTTVCLRSALPRYASRSHRLLDMGTGSYAVLAMYARRVLGVSNVWAADVVPEVVESARSQARADGVDVTFVCSDLFAGICEDFDVIMFNAPYLDLQKGIDLGLLRTERDTRRFCGGHGGGEVIRRFIADAPTALRPGGVVILGVNHYHLEKSLLEELLQGSRLEIEHVVAASLTRSAAYILRLKQIQEEKIP